MKSDLLSQNPPLLSEMSLRVVRNESPFAPSLHPPDVTSLGSRVSAHEYRLTGSRVTRHGRYFPAGSRRVRVTSSPNASIRFPQPLDHRRMSRRDVSRLVQVRRQVVEFFPLAGLTSQLPTPPADPGQDSVPDEIEKFVLPPLVAFGSPSNSPPHLGTIEQVPQRRSLNIRRIRAASGRVLRSVT